PAIDRDPITASKIHQPIPGSAMSMNQSMPARNRGVIKHNIVFGQAPDRATLAQRNPFAIYFKSGWHTPSINTLLFPTRKNNLSQPIIVRIHDLHEVEAEDPFIAMEYVDGPTLSVLRLQQPDQIFRLTRLAPLVQQLCEALDYAHAENVIHRDLKPSNLMLDS